MLVICDDIYLCCCFCDVLSPPLKNPLSPPTRRMCQRPERRILKLASEHIILELISSSSCSFSRPFHSEVLFLLYKAHPRFSCTFFAFYAVVLGYE